MNLLEHVSSTTIVNNEVSPSLIGSMFFLFSLLSWMVFFLLSSTVSYHMSLYFAVFDDISEISSILNSWIPYDTQYINNNNNNNFHFVRSLIWINLKWHFKHVTIQSKSRFKSTFSFIYIAKANEWTFKFIAMSRYHYQTIEKKITSKSF